MKNFLLPALIIFTTFNLFAQSIDDPFSQKKMRKDLEVFKNIRIEANSGLYKYRTKVEVDSIYTWASEEINHLSTYREFYSLIFKLSDFEGSSHNHQTFPKKYIKSLKQETYGYFPYPIKWVGGKWRLNFSAGEIPLGAEILSINEISISEIIQNLHKYYSTDGVNKTGKRIGILNDFNRFYRWNYGLSETFEVQYREYKSEYIQTKQLKSVSHEQSSENVKNRHSRTFTKLYHADFVKDEKYSFKQINDSTGMLMIYSFGMGNEHNPRHKKYLAFLDSVFTNLQADKVKNLIVDVRQNGGGNDPNDLVTYSFLTQRNFQENTQAWISFNKVPYLKYVYTKIPKFLRPLGVRNYNKEFQRDFPKKMDGRFYEDENSPDHKIRKSRNKAFKGNVYLLISPRVASAGSLFAAMLAGNENTITIGEETLGGYYGHNGHIPFGYILPRSKINTFFSLVNLEQDVPQKANQKYNRGIIPDYDVSQSFDDFLNHRDTQLDFTLELINKK